MKSANVRKVHRVELLVMGPHNCIAQERVEGTRTAWKRAALRLLGEYKRATVVEAHRVDESGAMAVDPVESYWRAECE